MYSGPSLSTIVIRSPVSVSTGSRFSFRLRLDMALDSYASSNPNQVHADVLLKARDSCYKARDAFYACLEKESGKKLTEMGSVGLLYPKECSLSRTEFVNSCRSSWVKHFDREYCRNKRVQRLLDDGDERKGPMSLPQPYTFKPTPPT